MAPFCSLASPWVRSWGCPAWPSLHLLCLILLCSPSELHGSIMLETRLGPAARPHTYQQSRSSCKELLCGVHSDLCKEFFFKEVGCVAGSMVGRRGENNNLALNNVPTESYWMFKKWTDSNLFVPFSSEFLPHRVALPAFTQPTYFIGFSQNQCMVLFGSFRGVQKGKSSLSCGFLGDNAETLQRPWDSARVYNLYLLKCCPSCSFYYFFVCLCKALYFVLKSAL